MTAHEHLASIGRRDDSAWMEKANDRRHDLRRAIGVVDDQQAARAVVGNVNRPSTGRHRDALGRHRGEGRDLLLGGRIEHCDAAAVEACDIRERPALDRGGIDVTPCGPGRNDDCE